VRATLVDEDGQALPFLLSSPEAPARPEVRQDGLVALIARQPLRQGTSYAVSVTADWKGKTQTWSWQFSTLHIPIIEVADLETISTSKHERIALRGTIREVRRTTSTSSYVEVHLQGTESVPALVAHLPVHRFLKAVGRPVTFRGDGSGTGFRVREVEGARVELETTLKDVSVASSGALLLQVPATQKGNGFRFLLAQ
jgi:hypothetical protein